MQRFRGILMVSGLLGVAVAAGCGDTRGPDAVVTDTLVVNAEPDERTPRWSLSDTLLVTIGREGDSLYEFNRIGRVHTLSDGRIVVANDLRELRYFDSSGRYVMTVGRRGQGPGEFQRMSRFIVLPGDTLVALNSNDAWWSALYFDSSGRFVRDERTGVIPSFRADDGDWIGNEQVSHGARRDCPKGAKVLRGDQEIARERFGPLPPRRLARILAGYSFHIGCNSLHIPFTPSGTFTVGAGRLFTTGDSGHVIHVRSLETGAIERTIRTQETPRRLTEEMIAYTAPPPPGPTLQRETVRGASAQDIRSLMPPPPPTLPAIGSLLTDAAGNLWVRRYYVPADTLHEWWVYNGGGRLIATFLNRARFRITEIGADYLLGVFRDEDDVESVRRYGLAKP